VVAVPWKGLVHVRVFPRTFPATTYLAARWGVEQARVTVLRTTLHAEVLMKKGWAVLEEEPIHTVEEHCDPVSWRLMVQLQPAGSEMIILKLPVTSLLFLKLSPSPGTDCGPLPAESLPLLGCVYMSLNFRSYSCQWLWCRCPDKCII
jgi:hypothetical protein